MLLHQSINQASAASERVFSRAGLSMSPRRSILHEQTLEMLTFLQCNLRLVPVPKPVCANKINGFLCRDYAVYSTVD